MAKKFTSAIFAEIFRPDLKMVIILVKLRSYYLKKGWIYLKQVSVIIPVSDGMADIVHDVYVNM
jgi:hypothetical protein